MKEIFLDVRTGAVDTITTTAQDNLNETYKLIIIKDKRRLDLNGKSIKMVVLNTKNKFIRTLDLPISNASKGEIELQLSNEFTRADGLLDCQIAVLGKGGFVEQVAQFSIHVQNSLFNDFSKIASSQWDFGEINKIFDNAANFKEDFPSWQEFISNAKNDEERRATTFKDFDTKINDMKDNYDKAVANVTNGNESTTNSEIVQARGKFNNLNNRLDDFSAKINDLLSVPIKIDSFTTDTAVLENGQSLDKINLSWRLNEEPIFQKFNDTVLDNSLREYAVTGPFTKDTNFALEVTDKKGNKDSKTVSLKFLNKICYGTSTSKDNNSTLIDSMQNKILSEDKIKNIILTANKDEYMVYCIPSSLGDCHFYINGVEDGFEKVATIEYTNGYGYKCDYDIYRTENTGLGTLNIEIR